MKSLPDVQKQIDDLFITFENIFTEAKAKVEEAKSFDLHRTEAESRLYEREKKCKEWEYRLEEEKAFLITVKNNQTLKEKQLSQFQEEQTKSKLAKEEAAVKIEEANKRISEATEATKRFEKARKDNQYLLYKLEDIKKREEELKQSELVDKNRKELLDARENRIKLTEERLQRYAA
jgi:hypothetical protein